MRLENKIISTLSYALIILAVSDYFIFAIEVVPLP